MRRIYTSIDLGSDTTKAICCELFNGKLHLLASSTIKSEGIRKSVITNPDLVLSTVTKAISELENDIGIKIEKVLVNVPSYSFRFNSRRS